MENREALILLNMVEGLSPPKAKELLSKLDEPKDVFSLKAKELKTIFGENIGEKVFSKRNSSEFLTELKLIEKEKIDILAILDREYPSLLTEIYDPPLLLYLKGRKECLSKKCLAIVGSRRASFYGLSSAEKFAYSLAYLGLVVVSGLARGIDTSAHKGALSAGGETVGVLGSGLLNIYPKENTSLASQIIERGCLISEFPLTKPPFRENFPRRNRVISGLSLGVLVVEATQRSGALITANFALEQGREIFALPGSYNSPQSKGVHSLIKQGAKLVDCVEDILEELNIELGSSHQSLKTSLNLSEKENRVFNLIDKGVKDIETLSQQSQLERSSLYQVLLSLTIKGLIKELPGKVYMKK